MEIKSNYTKSVQNSQIQNQNSTNENVLDDNLFKANTKEKKEPDFQDLIKADTNKDGQIDEKEFATAGLILHVEEADVEHFKVEGYKELGINHFEEVNAYDIEEVVVDHFNEYEILEKEYLQDVITREPLGYLQNFVIRETIRYFQDVIKADNGIVDEKEVADAEINIQVKEGKQSS